MPRTWNLEPVNAIAQVQYELGLEFLKKQGLRFPGGADPDLNSLAHNNHVNKHLWDAYSWTHEGQIDPTAGAKPSWDDLVLASREAGLEFFRTTFLRRLRSHCERRIAETIYGARNRDHEAQIRNRLRASTVEADQAKLLTMDRWRTHYRERYHQMKQWMNGLADGEINPQKVFLLFTLHQGYVPSQVTTQHAQPPTAPNDGGMGAVSMQQTAGDTLDRSDSRGFGFRGSEEDIEDRFHVMEDDAYWTGATWTPPGDTDRYDGYEEVPEYDDRAPVVQPPYELSAGDVTAGQFDNDGTTLDIPVFNSKRAQITPVLTNGAAFQEGTPGVVVGQPTQAVDRRAGNWGTRVKVPNGGAEASISYEAANYGISKKISVTTAGGIWSIGTPDRYDEVEGAIEWNDIAVAIPGNLVVGGQTAYLRYLRLNGTSGGIWTGLAPTPDGDSQASRIELVDNLVVTGLFNLVSAAGVLPVPAPRSPRNVTLSGLNPYTWVMEASAKEPLYAFIADLDRQTDKSVRLDIRSIAVTLSARAI